MITCICESYLNYEFHELCTIDDDYKSDLREDCLHLIHVYLVMVLTSKRVDQI